MKRLFFALLAACLLASAAVGFAEVDFDPSQYTDDELREIVAIINRHLSDNATQEGAVLIDSDDVYIEYRGLETHAVGYFVEIYIRNDTNEPLWLRLNNASLDGAQLSCGNSSVEIKPHSQYLSSTGSNSFILNMRDVKAYGITHGTNLKCYFTFYGGAKGSFDLDLAVDITP